MKLLSCAVALIVSLAVTPALAGAATASSPSNDQAHAPTVTVFAAASLKNAFDAAATAFKAKSGIELKISYAGSMALAKQIESGAPADVFVSADVTSMDYLAQKNLIRPETRSNFLRNALVVVAPKSSNLEKLPFTKEAFSEAIGSGKIATGDPASVPVGKYAKAALEKLGLWKSIEPSFAFTDNVRSALVFVAREEAPLGIVYLTDAKSEPRVKIVAAFPPNSHPPIVYPIAVTTAAQGDAPAKLLTFLESKAGKSVFAEQGFGVSD
jgi:molybdate transport system substrate-binding protein